MFFIDEVTYRNLLFSQVLLPDVDPLTIPEFHKHMVRSPPPVNWPRSPVFRFENSSQVSIRWFPKIDSHRSKKLIFFLGKPRRKKFFQIASLFKYVLFCLTSSYVYKLISKKSRNMCRRIDDGFGIVGIRIAQFKHSNTIIASFFQCRS